MRRAKVTLDAADAHAAIPAGRDRALTNGRYLVAAGQDTAGVVYHSALLHLAGAVHALAVLDQRHAEPGRQVTVAWAEHPVPGTAPEVSLNFPRIGATVQPAL